MARGMTAQGDDPPAPVLGLLAVQSAPLRSGHDVWMGDDPGHDIVGGM
jgi:hypothetical protein